MNLPIEHGVRALKSRLELLEGHHLEKSRLDVSVTNEKTSAYHLPAQGKKIARRFQERQDCFSNSKGKQVLGTVKWFSVKSGYGFINCNDTHEDIFIHQTAIAGKPPQH